MAVVIHLLLMIFGTLTLGLSPSMNGVASLVVNISYVFLFLKALTGDYKENYDRANNVKYFLLILLTVLVSAIIPHLHAGILGDQSIIFIPDALNFHINNSRAVLEYLQNTSSGLQLSGENPFEKIYVTNILDGVLWWVSGSLTTAVFLTRTIIRVIITVILYLIIRRIQIGFDKKVLFLVLVNTHPDSVMYLAQMYKEISVWLFVVLILYFLDAPANRARVLGLVGCLALLAWERFYIAVIIISSLLLTWSVKLRGASVVMVVLLGAATLFLIAHYYFGTANLKHLWSVFGELRRSLEGNPESPVTGSMGFLIDTVRAVLTPFPSAEKLATYTGIDYLLIFSIIPNLTIVAAYLSIIRPSVSDNVLLFIFTFCLLTWLFLGQIMPWAGRIRSVLLIPLLLGIFLSLEKRRLMNTFRGGF